MTTICVWKNLTNAREFPIIFRWKSLKLFASPKNINNAVMLFKQPTFSTMTPLKWYARVHILLI